MPYDSFDAAAEALAAANNAGDAPVETPSEQAPQSAAPEVDAGTPPAPAEDSFSNIDPNDLPPELRAQYANMQGAFTRKMQELSERSKQYEAIGDPALAVRGVELMRALEEDPVFVHQQLSTWLESQGMSPAQASAVASEVQASQNDDFGLGGADEYEVPEALRRELDELKQWRQQEEQSRAEQAYMAELQREEMAIRQSNPNYQDEDVNAIYELAFAHGGSLLRAESVYKQMQDRWAAGYLNQKANVPGSLNQPGSTGAAQSPQKFDRLDDPELEKAALAALAASLGES